MIGQIESKSIKKQFGKKLVLKDLSFVAEPSEITFIAGENGAGKTTWIRIALGLLAPTSGEVLYDKNSVNDIRNQVSVVFDEPPVYPSLSGMENLQLISQSLHFDKQVQKDIFEIFKFDKHFLKMKGKSYSFGQRHRLSIAAAILRKPLFMFLDEPSLGLDPATWQMINECLRDLAKQGTNIIVTGQDYRLMEEFVDKVVILKSGVAVFTGTISQLNTRFESRVCVRVNPDDDSINRVFSDRYQVKKVKDKRYEITCKSDAIAQEVIKEIKESKIDFLELYIRQNTLEESFQGIISTKEGEKL